MDAKATYRHICSAFVLLFILFFHSHAQNHASYTADFLSSQFVSCLHQDQQGYIWTGGLSGLYQYDGINFRNFSHQPQDSTSLSSDYVLAICEDEKGFLWIATDKGLNRYDKALERFELWGKWKGKTFREKITSLNIDENEQIWVGSENGLFQLERTNRELIPFQKGKLTANTTINCLLTDPNGNLWIGTETAGLFYLTADKTSLTNYSQGASGLESDAIKDILETQRGDLYVATGFGAARFDPQAKRFFPIALPEELGSQLRRSEVEVMVEDRKGAIWMGTFENALFKYRPTDQSLVQFTDFSVTNANNPINALLIDRSGLLWIGSYLGGLRAVLYEQKRFPSLLPAAINQKDVYAIFEDKNQHLWLGTSEGLEILDTNQKMIQSSEDEVTAFWEDAQGNIWLGTIGNGLKKWKEGQAWPPETVDIQLESNDFSLYSGINTMLEDEQQQLWIGTFEGVVVLDQSQNRSLRLQNDPSDSLSLSNDEVYDLFQDSKGRIWISTEKGLNLYDGGFKKIALTPEAQEFIQDAAVYACLEDRFGNMWAATFKGLIQFDLTRQQFRVLISAQNSPNPQLFGLLFDEQGDLWASGKDGLFRIKIADFGRQASIVAYNQANSELAVNQFNYGAYRRTRDNRLIFGGLEGGVIFRSEDIWQNDYAPPAVLNSFQIELKEVDFRDPESPLRVHISQSEKISLDPGLYRITLGFSALNFINPTSNRFRYRLDGVDKDWIVGRKGNEVEYPLTSGNYTFRLQAANNDGIWNDQETSFEIEIEKPFTETLGFLLLLLLFIALSVVAVVRFRTRQLEQTQRRLEEKVAARTEEVNKKNEALEETLSELKEAQTQLVEQEKMASLGLLTAGVAHEINNPITFVSGNITPLKRDIDELMEVLEAYEEEVKAKGLEPNFERIRQLKDELDFDFLLQEVKQLLNGIQEGAERTAEIVKGLRNFSRLDEDVLKKANINEGIDSTLLLLRSGLKDRVEVVRDMPEMPDIMCYPGKLNGVYMNIINNAMQAIEGEGKIFITTRHHGNQVNISIRDTGKGMSPEVQKRIFEPFFTTKDVGHGTGLGLSITYGAIELHKGKIQVNSELGKGTEFVIELPVTKE